MGKGGDWLENGRVRDRTEGRGEGRRRGLWQRKEKNKREKGTCFFFLVGEINISKRLLRLCHSAEQARQYFGIHSPFYFVKMIPFYK